VANTLTIASPSDACSGVVSIVYCRLTAQSERMIVCSFDEVARFCTGCGGVVGMPLGLKGINSTYFFFQKDWWLCNKYDDGWSKNRLFGK
jgi:hypothetical protein